MAMMEHPAVLVRQLGEVLEGLAAVDPAVAVGTKPDDAASNEQANAAGTTPAKPTNPGA
jgi:hypothetical protein